MILRRVERWLVDVCGRGTSEVCVCTMSDEHDPPRGLGTGDFFESCNSDTSSWLHVRSIVALRAFHRRHLYSIRAARYVEWSTVMERSSCTNTPINGKAKGHQKIFKMGSML